MKPCMFYLGGSDQPFTDWIWCDGVAGARIRHTGWRADEFGDCTIRGIVILLPHGRYMAGWSMGEGMASTIEPGVFDDINEAAQMADEHARVAADAEYEYQRLHNDNDED